MNKILAITKNKNVLWNVIGISINSFYSLFLVIFITRFNGIDASGQFSFAFYIASMFQTIGNYGGRIFQVSDYNEKYDDRTYVSLKMVTGIIMLIVSIIFCIINGYDIIKMSLIMIFILYRFVESFSDSLYGILQKNDNLAAVGKSLTIKVTISLVIFFILDFIFKNVVISSLGFVIGFTLILFIYDIPLSRKYSKIGICFKPELLKLLKESFLVFTFSFLSIMILNITRYIVDMKLTNEIQGYFSILIMPSSLIALSTQFVVQPMIKTLSDKYNLHGIKKFVKDVNIMMMGVSGFGLLCCLITYFIGVDILSIVYGINFMNYRFSLTLMIMAGIFSGLSTMLSTVLTIMRKLNMQFVGYVLSTLIALIVSFSIIVMYNNLNAALFAYLICMCCQFLIMLCIYFIQIHNAHKDRSILEEKYNEA
ncbi:MAG: hypothetical protein RSC93_12970 [Erysipelotrichaceae bacterium]